MTKLAKYRVSPTRNNNLICRLMSEAESKSTMMLNAGRYEGRRVEINHRMLYNFGTCSYMGLDRCQELQEAGAAAALSYGTQFSISRAYLRCPMYDELEALLGSMTGRPVLVAPSTTLAHLAALPALVQDQDAVLIDQFAHASLHMASDLLHDIPVKLVKHNQMDQVEAAIATMAASCDRIWYVIDGLYSMSGDFAPFQGIAGLLERWPQLHVYVDDAHGTGWAGRHGRGAALMHLGLHDRVVVALSLNKSFAAAGAALVLPNEDLKARIRRCGGPMLFSGPIQPPMLGIAIASAKRHLSTQHTVAQVELLKRIDYALKLAHRRDLPLTSRERSPIFFIPHDSVNCATDHVRALMARGFYVCPSAFPAVPINRPGVRFTITLHNELADIDELITAAAETLPADSSRSHYGS